MRGNKGYRKFLKATTSERFVIDDEKVQREARFDGKWVLQTDTDMTAEEVSLKYKELWMVEAVFRSIKWVLRTRPIYHKVDETIRGHVFCSFLALVLLKELKAKMKARGWPLHWDCLRDDLDDLEEITVRNSGKTFVVRSPAGGGGRLRQSHSGRRCGLRTSRSAIGADRDLIIAEPNRKRNVVPTAKSKNTTTMCAGSYKIAL